LSRWAALVILVFAGFMPSWLVTRAERAHSQSRATSVEDMEANGLDWALHLPVSHEINVTTDYR
jgi:hypothetical protein